MTLKYKGNCGWYEKSAWIKRKVREEYQDEYGQRAMMHINKKTYWNPYGIILKTKVFQVIYCHNNVHLTPCPLSGSLTMWYFPRLWCCKYFCHTLCSVSQLPLLQMTLPQAWCQGTECTVIHQNWEDVNNKMASSSAPREASPIQFDSCSWIPYVYTLAL